MTIEHNYSGKKGFSNTKENEGLERQKTNKVYPNPTKDILYFEIVNMNSRILVYTIEGRLMEEVKGDTKQLNISGYSPGLYFVTIISPGSKLETFKIVKQ